MRARKVSRVVGFVFVVVAMGGIGAAAWGGEAEPQPGPAVVTPGDATPSPAVSPSGKAPSAPIRLFDITWG
jgi:hypothetical protein